MVEYTQNHLLGFFNTWFAMHVGDVFFATFKPRHFGVVLFCDYFDTNGFVCCVLEVCAVKTGLFSGATNCRDWIWTVFAWIYMMLQVTRRRWSHWV